MTVLISRGLVSVVVSTLAMAALPPALRTSRVNVIESLTHV